MNSRTKRIFIDIVDMLSYNSGYAAGYAEGRNDGYEIGYKASARHCRHKDILKKELRKKELYNNWTPRLAGVLLLLLTAFTVWVLDGEATIAFITVPLGFLMILGKIKMEVCAELVG